jgi:hypothetical protein
MRAWIHHSPVGKRTDTTIGASELSCEETRPSRAERGRERKKEFQSWKVFKASKYHVTERKI